MNTPAAFRAVYSDWKLIKTRSVIQIVFETPIENSHVAYRVLGGMPDPGGSAWFDISPFNETATGGANQQTQLSDQIPSASRHATTHGGARKKSPGEVAGYLCTLPSFQKFLREEYGYVRARTEDIAANVVRGLCGVEHRSEIKDGEPSGDTWRKIREDFRVWELKVEVVG